MIDYQLSEATLYIHLTLYVFRPNQLSTFFDLMDKRRQLKRVTVSHIQYFAAMTVLYVDIIHRVIHESCNHQKSQFSGVSLV